MQAPSTGPEKGRAILRGTDHRPREGRTVLRGTEHRPGEGNEHGGQGGPLRLLQEGDLGVGLHTPPSDPN